MTGFETIKKSRLFQDFLRNEIVNGTYRPGDRLPSIRVLARQYNLSTITVNSVLSNLMTEGLLYSEQGKGTFVRQPEKSRRKGKYIVGVLLYDMTINSDIEIKIFNSIQQNLGDACFMIPANSYDQMDTFQAGIKGLLELGVDGLAMVPPSDEIYDPIRIKSIIPEHFPLVMINHRIPGLKGDFVTMDFCQAACAAAGELLQRGHRHIFLVRHGSPSIAESLLQGYRDALQLAGLSVNERWIPIWDRASDRTAEQLEACLAEIDGVIASDSFIYHNRHLFAASGKSIPGDLSLIGLNDTAYSLFMHPPLTAIPYPAAAVGKAAAASILSQIRGSWKGPEVYKFCSGLVYRSS